MFHTLCIFYLFLKVIKVLILGISILSDFIHICTSIFTRDLGSITENVKQRRNISWKYMKIRILFQKMFYPIAIPD